MGQGSGENFCVGQAGAAFSFSMSMSMSAKSSQVHFAKSALCNCMEPTYDLYALVGVGVGVNHTLLMLIVYMYYLAVLNMEQWSLVELKSELDG